MSREIIASVILLHWRTRPYIEDCLAALVDQEMEKGSYEIIFVDNGSQDDGVDFVTEHYPEVRLLRFDENLGFCAGNNRAAAQARGRYLAFLNVDTVVHPRWLPELIDAMQQYPSLGACQSNMLMPWEKEFARWPERAQPQRLYCYDLAPYGFTRYLSRPFTPQPQRTLFLSGASTLLDSHLLPRLGGHAFDERFFAYGEDIDLSLRVNSLGYDTAVVPKSVVYHRASLPTKVTASRAAVVGVNRLIANRFLAYYKNLYDSELLKFLPWLLGGAPLKLTEVGWQGRRQLLYLLPATLLTIAALIMALSVGPSYRQARRQTLAVRQRPTGWFYNHIVRGLRPPLGATA